ncbi:MAG: hypothetical protein P1U68_13060 [Verrucomicrobiales bacterium]|nr:hypothetical protein [Verrucomicrobiales bacterium]
MNRVKSITREGCFVACVLLMPGAGASDGITPNPAEESDFDSLKRASPFVRVLDPSETYVLRGVAEVEDVSVATLLDRRTEKTLVVTRDEVNDAGIQLVEISSGGPLDAVKATVSFAGEEVELGYDVTQFVAAPRSASNAGKGKGRGKGGGDGRRRGPSPEEVERYKALGPEKQKVFQQYIREVVEKYPDMPREERGNMIRGALIRLTDGQDLDLNAPADRK